MRKIFSAVSLTIRAYSDSLQEESLRGSRSGPEKILGFLSSFQRIYTLSPMLKVLFFPFYPVSAFSTQLHALPVPQASMQAVTGHILLHRGNVPYSVQCFCHCHGVLPLRVGLEGLRCSGTSGQLVTCTNVRTEIRALWLSPS